MSACRAGRRTPLAPVAFLLEMRARDERLLEVLRILDDSGHREPLIAVRLVVAIEVFEDHRVFAIGNAVLAKISRLQVRRDDLQRSALRLRRSASARSTASSLGWIAGG